MRTDSCQKRSMHFQADECSVITGYPKMRQTLSLNLHWHKCVTDPSMESTLRIYVNTKNEDDYNYHYDSNNERLSNYSPANTRLKLEHGLEKHWSNIKKLVSEVECRKFDHLDILGIECSAFGMLEVGAQKFLKRILMTFLPKIMKAFKGNQFNLSALEISIRLYRFQSWTMNCTSHDFSSDFNMLHLICTSEGFTL